MGVSNGFSQGTRSWDTCFFIFAKFFQFALKFCCSPRKAWRFLHTHSLIILAFSSVLELRLHFLSPNGEGGGALFSPCWAILWHQMGGQPIVHLSSDSNWKPHQQLGVWRAVSSDCPSTTQVSTKFNALPHASHLVCMDDSRTHHSSQSACWGGSQDSGNTELIILPKVIKEGTQKQPCW